MLINTRNEKQTDQQVYENLKEWHKELPSVFMSPGEWKKIRMKKIKQEGRVWSR